MGLIGSGTGDGDIHAAFQAAYDDGVCHVVAVADAADLQSFQHGLVLPDGHQVSQHLAGVSHVGETVDHGDGAIFGQVFHFLLVKGADHDAVAVHE